MANEIRNDSVTVFISLLIGELLLAGSLSDGGTYSIPTVIFIISWTLYIVIRFSL